MSRLVLPLCLLAALTACEDNPATQPRQPIVALRRAIFEAGSACQRVTRSGYVGEYENTSFWTATCEDKFGRIRDWALFVGPDESVQVRLCEDVVKAGLQPCTIKQGAKAPGQTS